MSQEIGTVCWDNQESIVLQRSEAQLSKNVTFAHIIVVKTDVGNLLAVLRGLNVVASRDRVY